MNSTTNITEFPEPPSSPLPELIESFRKLLLDVSGDTATLAVINDMVSEELQKASNSDTGSLFGDIVDDTHANIDEDIPENLNNDCMDDEHPRNLVSHVQFMTPMEIRDFIDIDELNHIYNTSQHKGKYIWLNDSHVPYAFGGQTYHPQSLSSCNGINALLDRINKDYLFDLDCCLVIRYSSQE